VTRTWLLIVLILSGCRGGRAPEPGIVEDGPDGPSPSPRGAPTQEDWDAVLEGFVQEMAGRAEAGDLEQADTLVDTTFTSMRALDPDVPGDVRGLLDTRARQRVAGYLRCVAVATGDPSRCDVLEAAWPRELRHCRGMYVLWRVFGLEVVREGGDCETLVSGTSGLPAFARDEVGSYCTAVLERDPAACRFPEGSEEQMVCRALALRDGSGACREVDPSLSAPWWPACCERGTESFVRFIDEDATVETSPALGAALGDTEGCLRALVASLEDDLSGVFREGAPGPSMSELRGGTAACRLVLPWLPDH